MHKWMRLPANDAAGASTNDTTETQIGTGITVPGWAGCIRSLHVHLILLRLTTKQSISGYIRLVDDKGMLDPLNFPLPIATALAANAPHDVDLSLSYPCDHDVAKNDTIRAYAALDEISTGVHTIQAYINFRSGKAPMQLKSQKSAVVAASQTANTKAGAATLSTIADRTQAILGFWNEFHVYPTADESMGGYMTVESNAKDWQKQEIPTNVIPSGLGTEIAPQTKPLFAVVDELRHRLDGVSRIEWPDVFPLTAKTDFNINNYMDGTNTVAPAGRYGIIWQEPRS